MIPRDIFDHHFRKVEDGGLVLLLPVRHGPDSARDLHDMFNLLGLAGLVYLDVRFLTTQAHFALLSSPF